MQQSSNKIGLILLVLIITVSGCADNSNNADVSISQTEGVSIQSFTSTPAEVTEGQPVTLEAQLKNQGATQANDVVARVYNPPFGDTKRSWEIDSQEEHIDSLRPADPEVGQPAIMRPMTWSLDAPDLNQGESINYEFITRVLYQYDTRANTEVQAMSAQRYREEGQPTSSPVVENSGGPIQVDATLSPQSPIVFYEGDNQDSRDVDVCVTVSNVGSGQPFLQSAYNGDVQSYALDSENTGKVYIELDTSGNSVSFPDEADGTISMDQKVKCFTMNVDRVSSNEVQTTIPLTITAEYGYYTESSTTVTVNGRGTEVNNGGDTTEGNNDVSAEWTYSDDYSAGAETNAGEYCPAEEDADLEEDNSGAESACECLVDGEVADDESQCELN